MVIFLSKNIYYRFNFKVTWGHFDAANPELSIKCFIRQTFLIHGFEKKYSNLFIVFVGVCVWLCFLICAYLILGTIMYLSALHRLKCFLPHEELLFHSGMNTSGSEIISPTPIIQQH